jgi:hypothetical protein
MIEIVGENIVFHSKAEISSNKNTKGKIYDNGLIIRYTNFDNFLKDIDGEEEIEKKTGKNGKRYHTYKIKLDKKSKELKGELIKHKRNVATYDFDNPYVIIHKTKEIKRKTTITN